MDYDSPFPLMKMVMARALNEDLRMRVLEAGCSGRVSPFSPEPVRDLDFDGNLVASACARKRRTEGVPPKQAARFEVGRA